MIKIISIFGTRPEAIKMAPLIAELAKHPNEIDSKVCVTAQHRYMLDQVLDIFHIVPDYDLDIMQTAQSLEQITTNALDGISEVIKKENPDLILVHGDTTTTMAASLAGFYNKIKVGHVEAGLRTYDKHSPFPEEVNRRITGIIADYHFAPTIDNKQNLIREGVSEKSISVTGNTAIDAIKMTVKDNYEFLSPSLANVDWSKKVILLTAHRRENWGTSLENICRAAAFLANTNQDIEIIYPVHLNPKVKEVAYKILNDIPNIHLTEPLEVDDLHNLIAKSYMVMTDSGGLQEEAPHLDKPVLVLRTETERPEAVTAGTVKVIGIEKEAIIKEVRNLLLNKAEYERMAKAINPYGDGTASKKIVASILESFASPTFTINIEESLITA